MLVEAGVLDAGKTLGDYEIVGVAGAGGMGVVYKARQRSLGRIVVLKVIREEISSLPEYRDRFLREARLAASVDHPHVVSVYDVGEVDDLLFLAMQWIDGQDLKQLLQSAGRLSPARAVSVALQLAGALDAVHSAGLVHRDVKPGNVLLRTVGAGDHAYLTDFGVAKPSESTDHLTRTGSVVGTSGYLSPEQIRGQQPGPRSDFYALGCLFFEVLTGRPPFAGDNEMALRWAHANDPRPLASVAAPELGGRYDRFFAFALAVDPSQRFASGREFADMLAAAHAGQEQIAAPVPAAIPVPHTPTAVGPATPIPPPQQTPPPMPPGYAPYGYGTPVPPYPAPYPEKSRSGNPLVLVLLALIALAGVAAGTLAATGVFTRQTAGGTPPLTQAAAKRRTLSTSPMNSSASTGATSSTGATQNSTAADSGTSATSAPATSSASNLASPGAAPVSSSAGAALQQYWMLVNEGHYRHAFSLETPTEQAQDPSFVSDKKMAQPMINVVSIGQPSSSSGEADVPIEFYAQDRYPSPGSDTICRYFQMTAQMVEVDGGDWLYDGPVSGTSQVTEEPGSSNCQS